MLVANVNLNRIIDVNYIKYSDNFNNLKDLNQYTKCIHSYFRYKFTNVVECDYINIHV